MPTKLSNAAGGTARSIALATLATVLVACNTGATSRGDGGDAGGSDGAALDARMTITVTPATAALTLPIGTPSVSVALHATNAAGRDVTTSASWSSSGVGASVANGMVTATRPGTYTIRATQGSDFGAAVVTVQATGDVVASGAPANAATLLGSAVPSGAPVPIIAYPLDGAIFPGNLHNVEVQVARTDAAQTLVRVEFAGELIAVNLVASCADIAAAPSPGGCGVTLPPSLLPTLVGASTGEHLNVRVRLARADGSMLVESAPREVRWSDFDLSGALYYWSTNSAAGASSTAIFRFDFSQPDQPPAVFFDQNRDAPIVHDAAGAALGHPCVGCHAISRDGTRMSASFGGSDPANFGVFDVATRAPIATRMGHSLEQPPPIFAGLSALSPDGSRVVTTLTGTMSLYAANATLDVVSANLFPAATLGGDLATEPHWSSDGTRLVFTGWNPSMYSCDLTSRSSCAGVLSSNGDVTPYGQIYAATMSATGAGAPQLLVPRSTTNGGKDYSSFYPAISDDNAWVVFDRASCSGPPSHDSYPIDRAGVAANCAGYNTPGARLMLVPGGGTSAPVDLARMNDVGTWTNSWPRWAPGSGTFRGQRIYWVAFSSKRSYGLRLAGDATGGDPNAHPQLWVGAITIDPANPTADPSHPPVWFPLQDADPAHPTGNHVPQWVAVYVPSPG